MLRVNLLKSHDIDINAITYFFKQFNKLKDSIDLVIFSDFNYGCLPQNLVDQISATCIKQNIPFFADSQSSSQSGDVSRFKNATMMCATERETRMALSDHKSGLQNLTNNLIEKAKTKNLVVKLGSDGLIASSAGTNYYTDSLPALNTNPIDAAGAGDALLAAVSLSFCKGLNLWESLFVGSVAAGIQVSRSGNIPISSSELVDNLFGNFR